MGEKETIHKLYQIAHKKLIKFIKEKLRPYDFNRGEFPLLFKLIKKGDGVTQKEICEMLFISKSTTSKVINSLVEKGYVRKEKDREDRRVTRIYLTEKEKEIEEIIEEIDERAEKVMMRGFDEDEKAQFRGYLERVLENLDNAN